MTVSANSRIIAGGNRRKQFLACTLAGSTDDAALYVSKRGFDAGHRNSWFMRDMDGDGRDDYCRLAYFVLAFPRGGNTVDVNDCDIECRIHRIQVLRHRLINRHKALVIKILVCISSILCRLLWAPWL